MPASSSWSTTVNRPPPSFRFRCSEFLPERVAGRREPRPSGRTSPAAEAPRTTDKPIRIRNGNARDQYLSCCPRTRGAPDWTRCIPVVAHEAVGTSGATLTGQHRRLTHRDEPVRVSDLFRSLILYRRAFVPATNAPESGAPMSAILDLPTELQEFLLQPLPQTLLLRGAPGSGKTTLSVSMLHSFPGQRFLVSSRVTEAELQREFPWVQWDTQVKLIDITNRGGTLKDASRVVAHLKEVIENPEKEPGLRGLWLPPPLQDAWSGTDPSRPSMVVIDSWDALVERYIGISAHEIGFPDRGEIERILLDLMVQTPMFLVLVVERTDLSQLDFLVNGVIETVSDIQN